MNVTRSGTFLWIAGCCVFCHGQVSLSQAPSDPDVIIVGAGIAGLSAALEATRGGARVEVVDMWSIFGGHAVMSGGGLAIVGSDYQRQNGVIDTPDLARQDFLEWGDDPDPDWVDYYVSNSNEQIGAWLESLGVTWAALTKPPGNTAARFHAARGRGLGLVTPIYRELLKYPSTTFRWNFKVTDLLLEQGRIAGVGGENMRAGARAEIHADHVILATGGFQSNLSMVLRYWPTGLPQPSKLLVGSGVNSIGLGHELVLQVRARFHRMDHQWNYAYGLPHPRYPGENRALNSAIGDAIWVNASGVRFVNEQASTKVVFPAVVRQEPAAYWAVFDEDGKYSFQASGSGWDDFERVQTEILENRELVIRSGSIVELAAKIGIDGETLESTIQRFNEMVAQGVDEDFGRFNESELDFSKRIEDPPFYAAQFYPMTRKSMGGVAIDRETRVINEAGSPVNGLYAAGELTGFAGVNGSAGLEGTFLGPSLLTGRVAGRTVLAEMRETAEPVVPEARGLEPVPTQREFSLAESVPCEGCHALPVLIGQQRDGYAHFERVHEVVLERDYNCGLCHAEMAPYEPRSHQVNRSGQIDNCRHCHLAVENP